MSDHKINSKSFDIGIAAEEIIESFSVENGINASTAVNRLIIIAWELLEAQKKIAASSSDEVVNVVLSRHDAKIIQESIGGFPPSNGTTVEYIHFPPLRWE